MRGRRAFGGPPIFGTAAAGMVIGHWISYRLAVPDPHLRQGVLAATGHGHWLVIVKLAVAFGLAGAVTVAARFSSRTPPRAGADALTWAIARLAVVQAVAFTGMEIVERFGTGAPVAGLFAHHLLVLGLAVQLLVAVAGGAFLFCLSRAARSVAEAARSLPHAAVRPVAVVLPAAVRPVRPAHHPAAGIRGPPLSLFD